VFLLALRGAEAMDGDEKGDEAPYGAAQYNHTPAHTCPHQHSPPQHPNRPLGIARAPASPRPPPPTQPPPPATAPRRTRLGLAPVCGPAPDQTAAAGRPGALGQRGAPPTWWVVERVGRFWGCWVFDMSNEAGDEAVSLLALSTAATVTPQPTHSQRHSTPAP